LLFQFASASYISYTQSIHYFSFLLHFYPAMFRFV
jgi:hypothetical protein